MSDECIMMDVEIIHHYTFIINLKAYGGVF